MEIHSHSSVTQWEVGGIRIGSDQHLEDVRSKVISIMGGKGGGVKFPEKALRNPSSKVVFEFYT